MILKISVLLKHFWCLHATLIQFSSSHWRTKFFLPPFFFFSAVWLLRVPYHTCRYLIKFYVDYRSKIYERLHFYHWPASGKDDQFIQKLVLKKKMIVSIFQVVAPYYFLISSFDLVKAIVRKTCFTLLSFSAAASYNKIKLYKHNLFVFFFIFRKALLTGS